MIFSCETRWQLERELNEPPSLGLLKKSGETLAFDSLKWSLKHQEPYAFSLKLKDERIISGTWDIATGEGILNSGNMSDTDILVDDGHWQLQSESDSLLSLIYTPITLGTHVLEFMAIDAFGESATISLILEVFENLPPIAVLGIAKIGKVNARHYVFEGASSFDKDRSYGGSINWYKFTVSDRIIKEGVTPELDYIFQEKGVYNVGLEVHDSDGATHQKIITTVID